MVLYFQIDGLGSLQWQNELKPGQWLFNDDEQTRKRIGYIKHFDQIADVTDVHYKEFLTPFLNDILNEVAAEQSVSVDKICSDHVDDLVTEALQETSYKECFNDKCTATPELKRSVPKNKINCPYCRKNLRLSHQEMVGLDIGNTYVLPKPRQQGTTSATKKSFRVRYDPDRETSHMEEVFSENQDHEPPSKSYLSEPVFVNPCSYNSVITILRNIGKKAGIKKYGTGTRGWITIYCDGSPFNLCVRVIMSTYTCTMCGESVTGFLKIRTHMSAMHETDIFEQPESADLEFDWAMMCPGPGHVEMNMVRSVVELSWSIFWESMCKEFNFRSENALKSQKKWVITTRGGSYYALRTFPW